MKKAKDLIIIGDQSTVIDKLIEFIDIVGPFGTLLITGHDFGNSRKLWESSFTKMSESVEPILSKYLKQKFHLIVILASFSEMEICKFLE